MRRGIRLGVDVGTVRVGVAVCDPDGILATPLETVARSAEAAADLDRIAALVAGLAVVEVVVGLPRGLDGGEGPAAAAVRQYASVLAERVAPVPLRLVDERLTTVDAHRALRDSGVAGRKHRPVVDQAAAVLILQAALDTERSTGRPPGRPVARRRRKPRTKGGPA